MTNRQNFDIWFGAKIRRLSSDREAGFIVAIVTFPLLERYLRQLTRAEPKERRFTEGLLRLFPELETVEAAERFWTTYRHGLLHNVTMSRETHGLTHDSAAVQIDPNGKVWLNPASFSERVLFTIENDFGTFERGQPLPSVYEYGRVPNLGGTPDYYLGTGMPSRQGEKK